MDENNALTAQNVRVINGITADVQSSPDNPLNISFPSSFVKSSGSNNDLRVNVSNFTNLFIPDNEHVIGFISCVHVVNSGVGYIFPINQYFQNQTMVGFESVIVPECHQQFSDEFSSATSIKVFYNYVNSTGLYSFGCYTGD